MLCLACLTMEQSTAIAHTVFDSFEIDESYLPTMLDETARLAAVRQVLIQRIEELLVKDLEKLMWILYRIDVSEAKVHEALAVNSSMNYAEALADLIIQRQIEKVRTRQEYGEGGGDWSFDV